MRRLTSLISSIDVQAFDEKRRLTNSVDEHIAKSDDHRLTIRDRSAKVHELRLMQAKYCT